MGLIPVGSIESLADGMEKVLERASEKLEAIGVAAQDRVRVRHSVETEVGALARYLTESSERYKS